MRAYEFAFVLRVDADKFQGVEVVDTIWDNHFITEYMRTGEVLRDYANDTEHKYYLVNAYCNQTMFGTPETHYHAVVGEYYHGMMIKNEMTTGFFDRVRVAQGEESYQIYTQVFNVAKWLWLDQVFGDADLVV